MTDLLKTPVRELTIPQLMEAIELKDRQLEQTRLENEEYGAVNVGIVMTGENWDAYHSPVTGELITNNHQRSDDLKKNGCVDSRELLSYGQNNHSESFE